ncbi:MAG: ChaN family lipoprotein [Acidobacteriota bacterium]
MPSSRIDEEIAFHRRTVSLLRREIARVDRNSSRKYIRDFVEEFRAYRDLSSYDDLIISCYRSDIIYVGDYHALPSAQEFAARLLREIASRSRQVILAVEMVYGRNQRILDRWMAGEHDDEEFKRRIRYDLEWGYAWEGFRAIFETARDYGVKTFGIDCPPRNGLRYILKRDRYAATKIVHIFLKHPGAKIFVVIGESHLASHHLPSVVRDLLARHNLEKRSVRVLQNLEEVYWRLVADGEEQHDVVTLGKNVFCVFNTSPIAKYEAYRQTINRWKSEDVDDHVDLTPTIYNMIDTILHFLGVDKYSHRMDRDGDCVEFLVDYYPEVYSPSEASSMKKFLASNGFHRREVARARERLARGGACYVAGLNAVFVGRFSLVHGGEEATRFVHAALRGDVLKQRSRPTLRRDRFYATVIEEALGFFGSKLIDPSRNHFFETNLYEYHRKDPAFIEAHTEYSYDQFTRIINFILLHKKMEKGPADWGVLPGALREGIGTRSMRLFTVLTRELGYYLGQQVYDGYHAGRLDRRAIRDLFSRRLERKGSALEAYLQLAENLPSPMHGG